MTRKGSLMPNCFFGSAGHWIKVVDTLVPIISKTEDWISGSVILLICPFRTFLSQIWSGFDPMEYRIDKNPGRKEMRWKWVLVEEKAMTETGARMEWRRERHTRLIGISEHGPREENLMRSQSLPNYKCRRAKTAVAKSFWTKRFCQHITTKTATYSLYWSSTHFQFGISTYYYLCK